MVAIIREKWWEAVLARDSHFDGTFVYGVRSTGIYCRPSCPSRRPTQDRVVFFQSHRAAELAGFRPCRRCRPDTATIEDPQVRMVECLSDFIERYDAVDRPLTLAEMSDYTHVSPHHLQRTFRRIMGITPRQYAEACRQRRLKALIKKGERVTDALYEAGYGSSSRLYEGAAHRLGMTPGAYRRGGNGMSIGYTIVDCPLGRLLVAATEKGVSAVYVGESDEVLESELSREYPNAEIRRDKRGLGDHVASLLRYFKGKQPALALPLDVRVTAFQEKVYEALRAIPYGSSRTYSEIAEAIGSPGRFGPWGMPAPRTRRQSSFRVTAW